MRRVAEGSWLPVESDSGAARPLSTLFLVWSGYRTGSTLLFNLLRFGLDRAGLPYTSDYGLDRLELIGAPELQEPLRLVKIHEELTLDWLENKRSTFRPTVFVALRSARGQLRSLRRLSRISDDLKDTTRLLKLNQLIQEQIFMASASCAIYAFRTDRFLAGEVLRLFRFLNIDNPFWNAMAASLRFSKVGVRRLLRSLFEPGAPSFDHHDPATLWHPHHIGPSISAGFSFVKISPDLREAVMLIDRTSNDLIRAALSSRREERFIPPSGGWAPGDLTGPLQEPQSPGGRD